MPEELKLSEPLEILEVECLTKPRDDGRKLWTKNWRVQVSNRFREHMLKPEAYPVGWSSRRYFPARAPRQQVTALDPTNQQPVQKRPNMGQGPSGQPPTLQWCGAEAPPSWLCDWQWPAQHWILCLITQQDLTKVKLTGYKMFPKLVVLTFYNFRSISKLPNQQKHSSERTLTIT